MCALQVLMKTKSGEEWAFFIKSGAVFVLLFWSLSESFNNEITRAKVWNVSHRRPQHVACCQTQLNAYY
jgi:hypothetical protein